jgi:predicted nucleic acid-binding protein
LPSPRSVICWPIRSAARAGLAAEFCAAIADDELRIIEVTPYDYRRMAERLTTYSSLRLQAVDACVMTLAERLDLHEVAALDRRDFQVVAPRHLPKGQRLRLLPED